MKVGDWSRARALLAAGTVGFKGAIERALRQEAEGLRKEIVQGLTQQAPGGEAIRPLADTTLAVRRFKNFGGTKALIVRADLRNAISATVQGDEAFVGVNRKARGRDGQSLANVAEVQEFGSAPRVIPMTPSMRRFLFAMLRESGVPLKQGNGSGVVVVQTPERSFMRPAVKKFQRGAQRRFLNRIAQELKWRW